MNDDVFYSAQSCVGWFTAGTLLWMGSIDAFDGADVQTVGPTFHLRTFMLACTLINCSKRFWLCTSIHFPHTIQTDTCHCALVFKMSQAVALLQYRSHIWFWQVMIRSLCVLTQKHHSGGKQKVDFHAQHATVVTLPHILWYNTSEVSQHHTTSCFLKVGLCYVDVLSLQSFYSIFIFIFQFKYWRF